MGDGGTIKISNAPDHASAIGALITQIEKERDLERSRHHGAPQGEWALKTKVTELVAQVPDPASLAKDTQIADLKARLSDALSKKSRFNSELQAVRKQLKDAQDAVEKAHKYHLAALNNFKNAAKRQRQPELSQSPDRLTAHAMTVYMRRPRGRSLRAMRPEVVASHPLWGREVNESDFLHRAQD
ncbi:hypothetical protein OC842_006366 [Tilletia horrida]|uniref:Uncharacterized protein n=1 Tax=Tilletia horrida TaxID=155126 RepID=A0AAN6G5M2_9BASI|nr:hypothetical protein OC842_006366 [Tilletia horrida]